MIALLFALGLSPSDAPETRYVPVKVYHFKSPSPELDEAKLKSELITLLSESIDSLAKLEKVDYHREKRIQQLFHKLELKGKR